MLAKSAFPAFFFTLAGFILFLLVTLSVPIIKTIYLLKIRYPGGSTAANIGILGTCYRGGSSNFPDFSGIASCTDPRVGYTLDPELFGFDLGSNVTRVVIRGLSGSLIINAIAAGVAGISLFFASFAWFFASRAMEIVLFVTLFFSAFAAWIAFWLDLALVLVARKRIDDYTNSVLSGHFGPALWMALAGAASLTAAICLAGCGMFGRYSDRRTHRNVGTAPVVREKPYGRNLRFWRRDRMQATY